MFPPYSRIISYWFLFLILDVELLNICSFFRNLSHNNLSGPIGNVFNGLQNLEKM